MYLKMDGGAASQYKSRTQQARFITENWASSNVLCPGCSGGLEKYANNSPVADFFCSACSEDFELKATSKKFGSIVPDGAYDTMIDRLSSRRNPNLLLLQYDAKNWLVNNLTAIPKYYFTPDIIQKRSPLSSTARRAGWVGCNILVGNIPSTGQIQIVFNQTSRPLEEIQSDWHKTEFLKGIKNDQTKGWLLQAMKCIDRIGKKQFSLNDIYKFENLLRDTYPDNGHIKEKLRQQLQVLRDRGYIRFTGRGAYELV